MPSAVALADLPIPLLKKLALGREMLNHVDDDEKPACAGMHEKGYSFDRAPLPANSSLKKVPTPVVPAAIQFSAYRFCAGCPVLQECRDWADAKHEEGLWGGVYRVKTGGLRKYQSFDLLAADVDLVTGAVPVSA